MNFQAFLNVFCIVTLLVQKTEAAPGTLTTMTNQGINVQLNGANVNWLGSSTSSYIASYNQPGAPVSGVTLINIVANLVSVNPTAAVIFFSYPPPDSTFYFFICQTGTTTYSSIVCTNAVNLLLPTVSPTRIPTVVPTVSRTPAPTTNPTPVPTPCPTTEPTSGPTPAPTTNPTTNPTPDPTTVLTPGPTLAPTTNPTVSPTTEPTVTPTRAPTIDPSSEPTVIPTQFPVGPETPTAQPVFRQPTRNPAPGQGNNNPSSSPTAENVSALSSKDIKIISGVAVGVSFFAVLAAGMYYYRKKAMPENKKKLHQGCFFTGHHSVFWSNGRQSKNGLSVKLLK